VVGVVNTDGAMTPLLRRPKFPAYWIQRGDYAFRVTALPEPRTHVAVSPTGVAYVTASLRYEVLAIDLATAQNRWLLRVERPGAALTEEDKEAAMKQLRERLPQATSSEVDWPSRYPSLSVDQGGWNAVGALEPLHVDGHGKLYVFPYVKAPEPGVFYPVDVYDERGELLGERLMPRISWMAARDDFVYGLEEDEDGHVVVVRYRLPAN
jgi:hypothetical protein